MRVIPHLLAAVALLCATAGPSAAAGRWVAAWAAAPHGAEGLDWRGHEPNRPQGFAAQSLRLVVTPHAAGRQARIRLSNAFGTRPVTIAAASIATRRNGAGVAARTLRPLTFDGQRAVTIPPGAVVTSDAVAFRVAPFRDVAVTLAFDAQTGPPTYHTLGLQTSYVSPTGTGDQTADTSGAPFTETTGLRWFLVGVDVLGPPRAGTIVAVGDSLTDGDTSLGNPDADLTDRNARYPDVLQRRLDRAGIARSVVNAGISGNQLLADASPGLFFAGPALRHRFERDVLTVPGLAGVILLIGTNDLGLGHATAPDVVAGLETLATRAHDAGLPIVVGTIPPGGGSFYDVGDFEARRQAVNAWIRSQTAFDGVVDFDAAVRDAVDPRRLQVPFDSGDHLHPGAAGYAAMAKAVDVRLVRTVFRGARAPQPGAGVP